MSGELVDDAVRRGTHKTSQVGVKFTLNQEIIGNIFVHHPRIKQLHQEQVPGLMTETEFWTRCLQSAYFTSTGDSGSSKKKTDELFDVAFEQEQQEDARPVMLSDFLVGVREEDAQDGVGPDATMATGQDKTAKGLFRKINQHSNVVLGRESHPVQDEAVPKHMQVLRDVTRMDDLVQHADPQYIDLNMGARVFGSVTTVDQVPRIPRAEFDAATAKCRQQMRSINMREEPSSRDASAGYASFMRNIKSQTLAAENPASLIPADMYAELCATNVNATEILKQYWSCALQVGQDENYARIARRMLRVVRQMLERVRQLCGTEVAERVESSPD